MTVEQTVRLVEITKRKADELFEELIAELQRQGVKVAAPVAEDEIEATDPTARPAGYDEPWSLGDKAPSGGWNETGRESGVTYKWPDGNVDHYTDFVTYQGTGGFTGTTLALGYLNRGDVVGFVLGAGGGSKRGITYFFPTDDFEKTNEKVSMIRGGGERGRGGFGPGDSLPGAYDGFKIEMLRARRDGKWNVQAVVAEADDHDTMLSHTAIQAKLRGLA
jgi:hypothetical protein